MHVWPFGGGAVSAATAAAAALTRITDHVSVNSLPVHCPAVNSERSRQMPASIFPLVCTRAWRGDTSREPQSEVNSCRQGYTLLASAHCSADSSFWPCELRFELHYLSSYCTGGRYSNAHLVCCSTLHVHHILFLYVSRWLSVWLQRSQDST